MDNSRPTGGKKFAHKLSTVWFSVKNRLKCYTTNVLRQCLRYISPSNWGNTLLTSVSMILGVLQTQCIAGVSCDTIIREYTLEKYCDMLLTLGSCKAHFSVGIHAGIMEDTVVGPYMLPDRMSAQRYHNFLESVQSELLEAVLRRVWFQHDCALQWRRLAVIQCAISRKVDWMARANCAASFII
jgi:hypothetical protein